METSQQPGHDLPLILVTGSTGFIGAHIVDALLRRGYRVRGTTRSPFKAAAMLASREQYRGQLEFIQVPDLTASDAGIAVNFTEAVDGVEGIIHCASPLSYTVDNVEKELVRPAILGTKKILGAAAAAESVKRVVITSSFAAVMDAGRHESEMKKSLQERKKWMYTAENWNPLTYEDSVREGTSPVVAYRGAKKFAERAAWEVVDIAKSTGQHLSFDIVTLCPPMTFGPTVHPISDLSQLNESNMNLWKVAKWKAANGEPVPAARVPFWIDVRDLANAHVEALLRSEAGGKRYLVVSPERFSYKLVEEIVGRMRREVASGKKVDGKSPRGEMGELEITKERMEDLGIDDLYNVDGETARRELGIQYTRFEDTVRDFVWGCWDMEGRTQYGGL